jgi:hypothetical protein
MLFDEELTPKGVSDEKKIIIIYYLTLLKRGGITSNRL